MAATPGCAAPPQQQACGAPTPRVCDARAGIELVPAILVDGSAPFPVVDANERWLSTCKFRLDEVVGKTLKILQGPRTEQTELQQLMRAVRQRSAVRVTLTNYDAMKKPFRNALTVEPVDVNGRAYFLATSVITFLSSDIPVRLRCMSPPTRRCAGSPPPPASPPASPPARRRQPRRPSHAKKAGRVALRVVGLEGCLPREDQRLMSGFVDDDDAPPRRPSRAKKAGRVALRVVGLEGCLPREDQPLVSGVPDDDYGPPRRVSRSPRPSPDTDPARALRFAAWKGELTQVGECLRRGAKIDATDADGFSALTVAARWNRVSMIETLVTVFGADITHRNRLGQTALDVAVEHENTEAADCLRELMTRGSSPSQTEAAAVEEGVPPEPVHPPDSLAR